MPPGDQNKKTQGGAGGRGGQGQRGQRGQRDRGGRGDKREPKEFEEEVLQIDRVTRVVKGGRRFRFRATVVIGNFKGKVGMGIGKSNEVVAAIKKAVSKAKKSLISVPLEGGTIPHDIRIKYGSARMILLPAAPGTGIIAGGAIRPVVKLAGIQNILSKTLGGRNRITNAKALMVGLSRLKLKKSVVSTKPTPDIIK